MNIVPPVWGVLRLGVMDRWWAGGGAGARRRRSCPALPLYSALAALSLLLHGQCIGGDWCNLDTGFTTITDGRGYPHSVYISVTRDGDIWMRTGVDRKSLDWVCTGEGVYRLQTDILQREEVDMLESINYTDYCVLTDLRFVVKVESGWHPSYITAFDPKTRHSEIMTFRHNSDCYMSSNLTFGRDKQGFVCGGGKRNACGQRHLPDKGQESTTRFLKNVNMDPAGTDSYVCGGKPDGNTYTFIGSYYFAYVKLASCDTPRDSRVLGHEAKLRAHRDIITNTVLIPDPTQTAFNSGVIKGFQVYAKIISIQHEVYLQVWRPSRDDDTIYTLVGQTFYMPRELRFQEIALSRHQLIRVRKGDVLGFYFPKNNPLAWNSVPCAYEQQHYKYIESPSDVAVDKAKRFMTAPSGEKACRHYSFVAVFANKTDSKLVEDWICPTAKPPADSRRRLGADRKNTARDRTPPGGATSSPAQPVVPDNSYFSSAAIPIHLILIIIGCLILLLIIVGFISYYRAIRS